MLRVLGFEFLVFSVRCGERREGAHMEGDDRVKEKSYAFALLVIGVARDLQKRKEFVLSGQLLRSGTSIGANIEEASAAQSRRDFIAKMSIASKEARETDYWLRL